MLTISMICWKRPDYLKKALASIATNDLSIVDGVFIQAEPPSEEMRVYLQHLQNEGIFDADGTRCPVHVRINPSQLGTDKNGFEAVRHVFEDLHTDINIHVEEDVILSSDVIEWAETYRAMGLDASCMCMCLHNHGGAKPGDCPLNMWHTQVAFEFNPYGWIASNVNWEKWLKPQWFTNKWSPDGKERYGWDWSLNYHCAGIKAAYTIQPVVSRATTIGEFGGVHMSPEFWRQEFAAQEIAP